MPLKDLEKRRIYERKRAKERKSRGYKAPAIRIAIERTNAIKARTPCADCGCTFPPICMDFDHLRDKVEEVSYMVAVGTEWKIIEAEIAKCEIVCACCHRIRTQLNHYNK